MLAILEVQSLLLHLVVVDIDLLGRRMDCWGWGWNCRGYLVVVVVVVVVGKMALLHAAVAVVVGVVVAAIQFDLVSTSLFHLEAVVLSALHQKKSPEDRHFHLHPH